MSLFRRLMVILGAGGAGRPPETLAASAYFNRVGEIWLLELGAYFNRV